MSSAFVAVYFQVSGVCSSNAGVGSNIAGLEPMYSDDVFLQCPSEKVFPAFGTDLS